jgi:hypothetical protein
MRFIDALDDPRALAPCLRGLDSWWPWRTYSKVLFGDPLTEKREIVLFHESTGLSEQPPAVREAIVNVGRGGGKSFWQSLIAVWIVGSRDWRKVLGVGETGYVILRSVDRAQARILRNYIGEIMRMSPTYRMLIKDELAETIRCTNGVEIEIKSSSFSVRGRGVIACLCDEWAFVPSDENSRDPDREFIRAVRPALARVPGSLLMVTSTPYARRGWFYETFKRHYGNLGGPLVWQASSIAMNPTLDERTIEQALTEDPEAARAEWLAEFRSDISSFISADIIDCLIVPGRIMIPAIPGVKFFGFCDSASGAGRDSFVICVTHKDRGTGRVVLDRLWERRPPFSYEATVEEATQVLREYNVTQVTGDSYAGGIPREFFAKFGIEYLPSDTPASVLFLNLLPLLTSSQVELLDDKRLRIQLSNLERRTRAGGKDLVQGFPGQNDDLANAVAGAVCLAAKAEQRKGRVYFAGSPPREPQPPTSFAGRRGRVFFSGRGRAR